MYVSGFEKMSVFGAYLCFNKIEATEIKFNPI